MTRVARIDIGNKDLDPHHKQAVLTQDLSVAVLRDNQLFQCAGRDRFTWAQGIAIHKTDISMANLRQLFLITGINFSRHQQLPLFAQTQIHRCRLDLRKFQRADLQIPAAKQGKNIHIGQDRHTAPF